MSDDPTALEQMQVMHAEVSYKPRGFFGDCIAALSILAFLFVQTLYCIIDLIFLRSANRLQQLSFFFFFELFLKPRNVVIISTP